MKSIYTILMCISLVLLSACNIQLNSSLGSPESASGDQETMGDREPDALDNNEHNEKKEITAIMENAEIIVLSNPISLTDDEIIICLKNDNDEEIYTGLEYNIEKKVDGFWEPIVLDYDVDDIEYTIEPHDQIEFVVKIYPEQYDYTVGQYRIKKICDTLKDGQIVYGLVYGEFILD